MGYASRMRMRFESLTNMKKNSHGQQTHRTTAKVLVHFGGSISPSGGSIYRLSSSRSSDTNDIEHGKQPLLRLVGSLDSFSYEDPRENPNDGISTNNHDDAEEYLDLVQLMAILIMPTLAKAGKEWNDTHNRGLWPQDNGEEQKDNLRASLLPGLSTVFPNVLSAMLKSVSCCEYPVLNAKLIQDLLRAHGEHERASDTALVKRMFLKLRIHRRVYFDEEALVKCTD